MATQERTVGAHAACQATPLVDEVLAKVSFPEFGTANWLRQSEIEVRNLQNICRQMREEGNSTRLLKITSDELEEFTSDIVTSPLLRALRRPLRQLSDKSSARRSVDEAIAHLKTDVGRSLQTHQTVLELLKRNKTVVETFGRELPGLTAHHLERNGLDSERISTIRTIVQAERALKRFDSVERMLLDYRKNIPMSLMAARGLDAVLAAGNVLSIAELECMYNRAVGKRALAAAHTTAFSQTLHLRREHLMRLAERLVAPTKELSPASSVIENVVASALAEPAHSVIANNICVLNGAVAALTESKREYASRFRWYPPTGLLRLARGAAPEKENEGPAEGNLYALHVGGGHICFTSEHRTLVKVYSASIKLGAAVECQVVLPHEVVDSARAVAEISPLFDGLEISPAEWQRASTRARVTVTASSDGKWFGTLQKKGSIAIVRSRNTSGAFRVSSDLKSHRKSLFRRVPAEAIAIPVAVFRDTVVAHGISTSMVHSALSDQPEARMRFIATDTFGFDADLVRRLHNEAALMRLLQNYNKAAAPSEAICCAQYIGEGQLEKIRMTFPLYMRTTHLQWSAPGLEEWLRSSWATRLHALKGFARIILAANKSNFALGSCALDLYEWGVAWNEQTGEPLPEPVLATAPHTLPFDERAVFVESDLQGRMARTRSPVIPRSTQSGNPADRFTDGAVFAGIVLEILALEPSVSRPLRRTWEELFELAANSSRANFSDSVLARAVGVWMQKDGGPKSMMEFAKHLTTVSNSTPVELAQFIVERSNASSATKAL